MWTLRFSFPATSLPWLRTVGLQARDAACGNARKAPHLFPVNRSPTFVLPAEIISADWNLSEVHERATQHASAA